MTKIEASTVIDRPVEDVWKFITELTNSSKWLPDGTEERVTSEGPLGVGTTCQISSRFMGRHVVSNVVFTDFELNRKYTAEFADGIGKRLDGRVSWILESVDGGKTRLAIVTEGKFNGLWKLAQLFAVRSVKRTANEEVSNVKRALELRIQH